METRSIRMRSHLARVRGLGANHVGIQHFWVQRLTAIALIPLIVWFALSAVYLVDANYNTFINWVSYQYNPVLLSLLVIFGFHHGQLGLQVIVEDYVRNEGYKLGCIIMIKFLTIVMISCSLFSILRITFGS